MLGYLSKIFGKNNSVASGLAYNLLQKRLVKITYKHFIFSKIQTTFAIQKKLSIEIDFISR